MQLPTHKGILSWIRLMLKRLSVYFVNTMHHLLEKSYDMNVFVSISISIFICHVIHTD